MTKDEAMKLALEALTRLPPAAWTPDTSEQNGKAISALREALAEQPAQQEPVTVPVGYWHKGSGAFFKGAYLTPAQEQMRESGVIKPLYPAAQRQWVGLTDEEVKNLCLSVGAEPIEVRLIEAKLKEKNT